MTFAEAKQLLEIITFNLNKEKGDILLAAAKNLEGRYKQRIFNKGLNSDDQLISSDYSTQWARIRKIGRPVKGTKGKQRKTPRGLQTGYVDLSFTGSLMGSIKVLKSGQSVILAIDNDKDYQKAIGNEFIQGEKKGGGQMEIFAPTLKEEVAIQNYIDDLVAEKIDQTLSLFI